MYPRSFGLGFAVCVAVMVLIGCTGEPTVSRNTQYIVNGTPDSEPAVVYVFNISEGGLCTGSLIAPKVVMTAKHCVQEPGASQPDGANYFVVGLGANVYSHSQGGTYHVQKVFTTPGVYNTNGPTGLDGALVGQDIGLLVLSTEVTGVTPLKVHRQDPADQTGKTMKVIGYGQTPQGETGTKYSTTTTVNQVFDKVIYTGVSTCQGDSGGPLIAVESGEIIGITSFGETSCGTGFAAYQAVYPYLSLIDEAITASGDCVETGEEVCDGFDNDCDQMVDEGCMPVGSSCTGNNQCVGGLCAMTASGGVCSTPCNPLLPEANCGDGFYCAKSDKCEGVCLPRGDGKADQPINATCSKDSDCESLFCSDPGDGTKRCLMACKGDTGMCLAGEACAAVPNNCGGCVDQAAVVNMHGLGEPCAGDATCRSSQCLTDGSQMYCTRQCSADDDCGDGFHCRSNVCYRGDRSSLGGGCSKNADCQSETVCAAQGDSAWCTAECRQNENCPMGFECIDAGGKLVCAPKLGLVGSECSDDADCVSQLCIATSAGKVCSRVCDGQTACEVGRECRRDGDQTSGYCVLPGVTIGGKGGGGGGGGGGRSDGCSVGRAPGAFGSAWVLVAVGLALGIRRRRPSR